MTNTIGALRLEAEGLARGITIKGKNRTRLVSPAIRRDLALIRAEIEAKKPQLQKDWEGLEFSASRNRGSR
jgi:hypothetical protein